MQEEGGEKTGQVNSYWKKVEREWREAKTKGREEE